VDLTAEIKISKNVLSLFGALYVSSKFFSWRFQEVIENFPGGLVSRSQFEAHKDEGLV